MAPVTRDRLSVVLCIIAATAGCATGASSRATVPASTGVSAASGPLAGTEEEVQVVARPEAQRVDVLIAGQPFTSYIYPSSLKKPVLFPLRTASGTVVTRGYPLEPRPGERVDHPHHAGLWFNYGNVNGLDFWNNSTAIKPEDASKMGTIVQRSVDGTTSGRGAGSLDVTTEWVDATGTPLLREASHFVFRGGTDLRAIDRITTLTALDRPVEFIDDKEGLIGMRVARGLEQPSTVPEKFTDASGRATAVAVLDNTGVTGRYQSSEGREGDAVWGTRGRWATLSGVVNGEAVRIAMLDHPKNPGFPTYWHARGYGLFAANPLGQKIFSNGREQLNLRLAPGQAVTFRHEVLIMTGVAAQQSMEPFYDAFTR